METLVKTMSRKFLHKFWGKHYHGRNRRVNGYCSHCGIKILFIQTIIKPNYTLFIGTRGFSVGPKTTNNCPMLDPNEPIPRDWLIENICKKFVLMA